MKRREFILSSALALGSGVLLSGCGKKELVKSEKQVLRRKYKDITVPLLGLGCMRLPMKDNEIDQNELDRMVDYCMEHGVNYFDTAYMYVDSKSENAIGKSLKRFKREDFFLRIKALFIK